MDNSLLVVRDINHKYIVVDNGVNSILEERKIEEYKVKNEEREYTLLSFIFQFNQMLMMINNPMFFPHKAYVDMFNKGSKEE